MSNQATGDPVATLLSVSLAGAVLVGLRVLWTGDVSYVILVWNLFLAWLPLLFAMGACRQHQTGGGWRFYALAALWLLFFPNAPYVFTDLVHLDNWFVGHFWVDLSLILLFGFTAFVVGFLSLYLMQTLVASRFGRMAGWGFILAVTGLSAIGVYLGRVLRFNSWDVFLRPLRLSHGVKHWAGHPLTHPGQSVGFPVLFATFSFLAYVMLYALTHLRPLAPLENKEGRA